MQTQQQTTWMHYLQLGVIISILLLNNSCKKSEEYEKNPTFYIVNETNHKITFDGFPENYSIATKATTKITENQVVKGNLNNESSYSSPYKRIDKSPVTVRFDNVKCLLNQLEDNEHSIFSIKSFIAEKISKYDYKFTYIFTEEDYNRAVTCP